MISIICLFIVYIFIINRPSLTQFKSDLYFRDLEKRVREMEDYVKSFPKDDEYVDFSKY